MTALRRNDRINAGAAICASDCSPGIYSDNKVCVLCMERTVMWIMAFGALLGGLDRLIGNRFGLGKKFEQGFELMGSTALSMAGILCLSPLLARLLQAVFTPLCAYIGVDPAMLAGILAIDMGGYTLSLELAADAAVGRFSGVIVAATLGCTVSFTIPIGMGMLRSDVRRDFSRGILFGVAALPVSLVVGGLLCGLAPAAILVQSLPALLLAALVLLGLRFRTNDTIRAFSILASFIRALATIGLTLGAFQYMTGCALLPGLSPLPEAMEVVASIAIVMLGSLPMAELLMRLLRRPLRGLGARTGMNEASIAALLVGAVSVLPAIAMVQDMDARGRVVNAAAMVCSASAFAAHLGFIAGVDASMILPLFAAKFAGALAGAGAALWATRRRA